MSRRALPVAVAAAALVLVPSTASATPVQAPVENIFGAGYSADSRVVLDDGRHATVWIGEYRGAPRDGWEREIYVSVWSEYTCYEIYTCQTPAASGGATLTGQQVDFSRDLRQASVTDVPLTLRTWAYDPVSGYTSTEESVVVSASFTGTGEVTRNATHGDLCGDGGRTCESIRITANRGAEATVTLDDRTGTGSGALSYMQGIDAAAPKYELGYPG
jgi:hypothetical protein